VPAAAAPAVAAVMMRKLPIAEEQCPVPAEPVYLVAAERFVRPVKQVPYVVVVVAAAANGEPCAARGQGPVFEGSLYLFVPEMFGRQVEQDCPLVAVMERRLRLAVEKRRGLEEFVFAAAVTVGPFLEHRVWKSLVYLDKGPYLVLCQQTKEKFILMEASIILKSFDSRYYEQLRATQ
jgi:hypothetical protein